MAKTARGASCSGMAARLVYLNDPVAKEAGCSTPRPKPRAWPSTPRCSPPTAQRLWHPRPFVSRLSAGAEWAKGSPSRPAGASWASPVNRAKAGSPLGLSDVVRPGGEPGVLIESDTVTPAAPGASAVETRRDVRVLRLSDLPRMQKHPCRPAPAAAAAPMPLGDLAGLANLLPRGRRDHGLAAKKIEGVRSIASARLGRWRPARSATSGPSSPRARCGAAPS